ncbi:hypothetical protein H5410_030952 [Solanum commersonii]|uniref:Uncharacterized protein n=1 Tax=Solanum commersonii TaxID=4109 RepID=A0A9J5YKV0_SOLCO|nr:hypothetical protein H5410_030952 [Solanum commersonii]
MRRLLLFILFPSRINTLKLSARFRPPNVLGNSPNALVKPQAFFFVFSAILFLFANKLKIGSSERDVSNSATQDSIMNAHTSLNLLMQRSNVHSKFQVVTHHYQRISSS